MFLEKHASLAEGWKVGARTASYKKGLWGIFYQKKADKVAVISNGWYYDNIPEKCRKINVELGLVTELNSNYVGREETDAKSPGFEPGRYGSLHWLIQDGVKLRLEKPLWLE